MINWYPGHMVKSQRMIKEALKIVDVIVQVVDARAPLITQSMFLEKFNLNKPIITVLNKEDLAYNTETNRWILYFKKKILKLLKPIVIQKVLNQC